jgi:hypothetical protein
VPRQNRNPGGNRWFARPDHGLSARR